VSTIATLDMPRATSFHSLVRDRNGHQKWVAEKKNDWRGPMLCKSCHPDWTKPPWPNIAIMHYNKTTDGAISKRDYTETDSTSTPKLVPICPLAVSRPKSRPAIRGPSQTYLHQDLAQRTLHCSQVNRSELSRRLGS